MTGVILPLAQHPAFQLADIEVIGKNTPARPRDMTRLGDISYRQKTCLTHALFTRQNGNILNFQRSGAERCFL